jgi:hypothetical protein
MFNKLTSLLIGSSLAILPIGFTLANASSAIASSATDRQWQTYLNGSKTVQMSSYSSGNGGGGLSSKKEFHFCSNGELVANFFSSVSVNATGSSFNDGGNEKYTGTWKIVQSNQDYVVVEVTDTNRQKIQVAMGFKQDRQKLYGANGNRLYHVPSDVCQ